jgi:hypothetical protein
MEVTKMAGLLKVRAIESPDPVHISKTLEDGISFRACLESGRWGNAFLSEMSGAKLQRVGTIYCPQER